VTIKILSLLVPVKGWVGRTCFHCGFLERVGEGEHACIAGSWKGLGRENMLALRVAGSGLGRERTLLVTGSGLVRVKGKGTLRVVGCGLRREKNMLSLRVAGS
jgi:hypothetical protein